MKYFLICLICFASTEFVVSQKVEVPTRQRDINALLKKAREEDQANKLYFSEDEKCRKLTNNKNFPDAENSCRLAISYAEKLPRESYLERSSAYESLAYVFIWERKSDEAIPLLNKSLEIGKPVIDDTDAETGDRYFLLGQAYHQLGKVTEAGEYYTKAENTYRIAFKKIDVDEIRGHYPQAIVNILEAHLGLLKNVGSLDEATKIEKRLAETRIEFSRFLEP